MNKRCRFHLGYHFLAILTVAVWGVTFVNTKLLLSAGMLPMEIFFVRFIIAYLCIWTISPRRLFADNWQDELCFLFLGITGGSVYFIVENTALQLSLANNVSFIVCTAPLITMLLAILVIKSVRASVPLVVGSLTALIGMGLVVYNGHFVLHLNPLGDLLAFAAAICWAVYSLLIKRVSLRYKATFVTRKVFFYGILTVLPFFIMASFAELPGIAPWRFPLARMTEPVVFANLLFLSVMASFACFLWWSVAVKKLGALRTSNYVYLNPVFTVVASSLILSEPMTLIAFVGSVLILIGVYIANRQGIAQ